MLLFAAQLYHCATMNRIAIVIVVMTLAAQAQTTQTPPAQQMPAPGAPRWQPPDPTNLQVLPKDIPKAQLVQTMRGFAMGLGVRCEHCHVGNYEL